MVNTEFIKGWQEAVAAVELRMEFLKKDIDSRTKPWDLYFDIEAQVKEVKLSEEQAPLTDKTS